jgi:hypothetical protein
MGSLHFGGLAFGDHVVEDFQYRSGTNNATCASAKSRSPATAGEVAVSGPPPDCVARFLPFTTGGLGPNAEVRASWVNGGVLWPCSIFPLFGPISSGYPKP